MRPRCTATALNSLLSQLTLRVVTFRDMVSLPTARFENRLPMFQAFTRIHNGLQKTNYGAGSAHLISTKHYSTFQRIAASHNQPDFAPKKAFERFPGATSGITIKLAVASIEQKGHTREVRLDESRSNAASNRNSSDLSGY